MSRSNVIRDAPVNLNGFALLNACTSCLVFMGFPEAAAGVTGASASTVNARANPRACKMYKTLRSLNTLSRDVHNFNPIRRRGRAERAYTS